MTGLACRFGVSALMLAALAACNASDAPTEDGIAFEPIDPGLLGDGRFERIKGQSADPVWALTQHAGPLSYTVEVKDGVARVERIGGEPWGHFSHLLRDDSLAGQWLEFSAEIRGELDDSHGEPMQPTGPSILVRGRLPGDLPMMGARILYASEAEFGLDPGSHPWRRHAYRFQVPEAVALEINTAVQLTHGGWIEIRNPRLVAVEPPAE
jgi:hypothetical protein